MKVSAIMNKLTESECITVVNQEDDMYYDSVVSCVPMYIQQKKVVDWVRTTYGAIVVVEV